MREIEMKILIGMHRNVNELDKKTASLASKYKLTFSQFMVLESLYRKGSMTVGEVRDSILSSVGTISLIINNLVKLDYVKRLPDENDRRVCLLELTEQGHSIIRQLAPQNEKMIVESMSTLEEKEKEELLNLLKKLGGKR